MVSEQLVELVLNDYTWAEPHVDILSLAPDLTYREAYELQFENMRRRVEGGDRIVGYKAAGTSIRSHGVLPDPEMPLPIVGTLLASNLAFDGVTYSTRPGVTYVEAEIAAVLKSDLSGPYVNEIDAARAIDALCPAIEIGPWSPSTVAKQRSGKHAIATHKTDGMVVLGLPRPAGAVSDLRLEGGVLMVDGRVVDSGAGAEAMGSPLIVLAAVARHLSHYGMNLQAGMIVMTGSITKPLQLPPAVSSIQAIFASLGASGVRINE